MIFELTISIYFIINWIVYRIINWICMWELYWVFLIIWFRRLTFEIVIIYNVYLIWMNIFTIWLIILISFFMYIESFFRDVLRALREFLLKLNFSFYYMFFREESLVFIEESLDLALTIFNYWIYLLSIIFLLIYSYESLWYRDYRTKETTYLSDRGYNPWKVCISVSYLQLHIW